MLAAVTLRLYPTGLIISARLRPLSLLVPTWKARYDELARVSLVRRSGVRLTVTSGDKAIFWSYRRDDLVSALEAMRVPVEH
jgi:hypothetical protein